MSSAIKPLLLLMTVLLLATVMQCNGHCICDGHWEHVIYVNDSGVNDSTCWDGSIPCNNLNQALTGIHVGNHTKNNTVVCIYAGRYKLYNKTENIIHYRSHIAIIGFVNSVVIECDTYTGLSFVRTDNITLRNLTLHGCGSVQSSTSKNFNPNHPSTKFLNITVAVYMLLCTDVLIDSVTVQHSNGSGMIMYNVLNASITHSCFDSNGLEYTNDTNGGGGGLQVEFAACFPEYNNCSSNYRRRNFFDQSDAWFIIEHTIFKNNTSVRMPNYLPYKLPNEDKKYYAFGRGGGVAIIFKGQTENKHVILNDIKLVNNSAHYGGGFYIAYHDNTKNNSVTIENSCISNNSYPIFTEQSDSPSIKFRNSDGAGGGGKVLFAVARHPHYSKSNKIKITDCTFDNNTGMVGGGFAIEAIFSDQKDSFGNTLVITNSHFIRNVAFLGSGLYFSRSSSSSDLSPFLTTNISNVIVEQSKLVCSSTLDSSFSTLPCSGTFYINNYPVTLQSNITFVNNNATGLELHSSILTIDENAIVKFLNNRGEYGGAIGIYDCSYITLKKYTTLHFISNNAKELGGAIYSSRCTLNNQPTTLSSQCFFRYYNTSNNEPSKWNATLYFENNTYSNANDNAIYAYDVIPCWELIKDEAKKPFFEQLQSTFCWNKTWKYHDGNCSKHVDSPAAILEVDTENLTAVKPGGKLGLPLTIYNGNGQIIRNVELIVCIKCGPASFSATENKRCQTTKLNENSLVIYKHHNDEILMATHSSSSSVIVEYVTLTVKTTDFAPYQVDFIAKFEPCKWPYTFNNAECVVDTNSFCCSDDSSCTNCNSNCSFNIAKYVQEKIGHCVSNYSNGVLVDGQCPWLYYNHKCSLVQDTYEHCRDTREGRLCGKCKEGHSVAINSLYLECVSCKSWSGYKGWLILLAVEFLPLTVLILLVLVLKLDVSNGTVNGLILYCQVITLQLPGWFYPGWTALYWMPTDLSSNALLERSTSEYKYLYVHAAAVTPLSIWNLNFLPLIPLPPKELPVCISDSLSPLGAILFWYLIAFYPLIILAVVSIWTILYFHKNYLLTITRPIHRKLARFWLQFNITPSLFTSAATIYTLCFTQLTQTSFKLLNFASYKGINDSASGMAFYYDGTLDYFGWYSHFLAGSLAVAVLLVIVVMPVVWLAFYPFRWFQRILNCCRLNRQWLVSLADVVTGQFKNGLNDTKDFRYFAGLFFLFRALAIVIFFVSPYNSPGTVFILCLQIALTVNSAGVIMIVRPYKENIHNLTNFFLFLHLALLSGVSYIPMSFDLLKGLVVLTYAPIIFALSYAAYYILRKALKQYKVKDRSCSNVDFLPDRIVRPSKYKEHHVGVMPDDRRPREESRITADSNDVNDQQYSSSESCPIFSDESASQRQLLLPKEMQDAPLSTPTSDQTYMYGSIQ